MNERSGRPLTIAEDLLAGSAAGVAILLVGHPFDLIKVRVQTSPHPQTALGCLHRTVRREGLLSLYKGMAAPMAAVPAINAIVFAAFQQSRAVLVRDDPNRAPTALEASAAGAIAGLVNSVVVGPIELVKCRLQIETGRVGVLQCLRNILARDGVRGLFRGMSATMVREVPCYAAQFYTYESLKAVAESKNGVVGVPEQLVIGGLSGVACWTASYPQDVVKSLLQTEMDGGRFRRHSWLPDGGFVAAWSEVVQRGGWRGLWRGFAPCLVRAFPANAAGFFAYESARQYIIQF